MVEITDLNDATIHRRHRDQIHFKDVPEDPVTAAEDDQVRRSGEDTTEVQDQDLVPSTSLRRSVRQASQIDKALLRERGCGKSTSRASQKQTTTQYKVVPANGDGEVTNQNAVPRVRLVRDQST